MSFVFRKFSIKYALMNIYTERVLSLPGHNLRYSRVALFVIPGQHGKEVKSAALGTI